MLKEITCVLTLKKKQQETIRNALVPGRNKWHLWLPVLLGEEVADVYAVRGIDIETQRISQTCFNNQNQPPFPKHHQNFIKVARTTLYPILGSCLSFLLPTF